MAPHCFQTIIIAEDTPSPITKSSKRKRDLSDVGDAESSKRPALKDITNVSILMIFFEIILAYSPSLDTF